MGVMTKKYSNPWNDAREKSGIVHLPGSSYSLSALSAGPAPRAPHEPLVILFPGAGAPVAFYTKAQKALSKFVRILFYDRAGYDQSTMPKAESTITAQQSAVELGTLLQTIDLRPPYLLVAHSYGGIVAREFLHLQLSKYHPKSTKEVICGMVMFDTATELAFKLYSQIPSRDLLAVTKDVDWAALTHLKEDMALSDTEWEDLLQSIKRSEPASRREDTHGSAHLLAYKAQLERHALGDGSLVVVRCNSTRDYQLRYDEGVRLGGGTPAQREGARKFIQEWSLFNHELSRAQLDLIGEGGKCGYTYLPDWGHDGPIRNPALLEGPIRWIIERMPKEDKRPLRCMRRDSAQ